MCTNERKTGAGAAPKDNFLVVGVVISVITNTDEKIVGEVYAYDPITTCLVLRT